jgi:hypothetical protein
MSPWAWSTKVVSIIPWFSWSTKVVSIIPWFTWLWVKGDVQMEGLTQTLIKLVRTLIWPLEDF